MLKTVISHFSEDFLLMKENYSDKIELENFEWKDYLDQLSKYLLPLEITKKDLQSYENTSKLTEHLFNKIMNIKKIDDYLIKNNFLAKQKEQDLVLINISRIDMLNNSIINSYLMNLKNSLDPLDDQNLCLGFQLSNIAINQLIQNLNENYLFELKKSRINIEEYTKNLNEKLIKIGLNADYFFDEQKSKQIERVSDKFLDQKLDRIEEELNNLPSNKMVSVK